MELNNHPLSRYYLNGVINIDPPSVSVINPKFLVEGWDAEGVINEIQIIWSSSDKTEEEAFNYWINLRLKT